VPRTVRGTLKNKSTVSAQIVASLLLTAMLLSSATIRRSAAIPAAGDLVIKEDKC
jgi:hypothetical protein